MFAAASATKFFFIFCFEFKNVLGICVWKETLFKQPAGGVLWQFSLSEHTGQNVGSARFGQDEEASAASCEAWWCTRVDRIWDGNLGLIDSQVYEKYVRILINCNS